MCMFIFKVHTLGITSMKGDIGRNHIAKITPDR